MKHPTRRQFLQGSAAAAAFGSLIDQALAVAPAQTTGSVRDVAHVVILTQENRSFDHYFGALRGVRGWGDRFALPTGAQPFHLDTRRDFALMRAEGTPHSWGDAQAAWDHGRMRQWTQAKGAHSVAYYRRTDLPFHYALADAFTVCDAYHCSFHGGTNTNRLFLWTGTNDPQGRGNGPALYNELDSLKPRDGVAAYTWTTYAERLQAAGVSWQVYQDMADNYDDNPLAGFAVFREANEGRGPQAQVLRERALSTRNLTQMRADVQAGRLPQVSWVVPAAADSEHPEKSSPAQGADTTFQVLQVLTSNPEVWRRTVLIVNFDENDGYFDHMPPPAVPSVQKWEADPSKRELAGASTVDTSGEYHERLAGYHDTAEQRALLHRPYGLGMRVPMLLVSPWSRGGWVNSQVFDHTSVLQFLERCFGVAEPSISPWRRAVCGDLTSAFDFGRSLPSVPRLPATGSAAQRAAALPGRTLPVPPTSWVAPVQEKGVRPSRALPYELHAHGRYHRASNRVDLRFENAGTAGAVFHVYDQLQPQHIPRRYTVGAGQHLSDTWSGVGQTRAYDLWVLGPNGFFRRFAGSLGGMALGDDRVSALPEVQLEYDKVANVLVMTLHNLGGAPVKLEWQLLTYAKGPAKPVLLAPRSNTSVRLPLHATQGWYDLAVRAAEGLEFERRCAGRMETGRHSISDPALGGR